MDAAGLQFARPPHNQRHVNAAFMRIDEIDVGEKRLPGWMTRPIGSRIEGIGGNVEIKISLSWPVHEVTGLPQQGGERGRRLLELGAHVMRSDRGRIHTGNKT